MFDNQTKVSENFWAKQHGKSEVDAFFGNYSDAAKIIFNEIKSADIN